MDYTSFIFSDPPRDVDAPIFVDADFPERSISWRQYVTGVKRAAVGLQAIHSLEQECVALLSHNDIYISILGDAVTAAGAIFAGLPAEAKETELTDCCTAAKVKCLFVMPQLVELGRRIAQNIDIPDENVLIFDPPGLENVSLDEEDDRRRFSWLLRDHDESTYCNPNRSKDLSKHIASRLFTSGTTGTSKAADVSHRATINRIRAGLHENQNRDVELLHFIGMHHVSGTVLRQQAIAGYHRMYVTNARDAHQIISLIRQFNIESVMMPPRIMIAMIDAVEVDMGMQGNLQSLRHVIIGGSHLPADFLDDFSQILSPQAALHTSYGSTEMGCAISGVWRGSGDCKNRPGYTGAVMPTSSVRIFEPDSSRICAPGVDGEICANNDQLFTGYHGNQEATESSFAVDEQGLHWFRSGDKGSLSSNHELCVTGRYKEVFKVGTEEVSPAEVVSVLLKHEGVDEAAVVGREDRHDSRYHEVQAFVVPSGKKTPVAQELVDFVADTLSPHKAPTGGVTMVEEIPKNAMQKVIVRNLQTLKPLPGSRGYMDTGKV